MSATCRHCGTSEANHQPGGSARAHQWAPRVEVMGPRIGELFAGYGGLGMGVQAVYGGTIAWVSDIDKGANKILAHRFPGVPNHGDITTIDWADVEPVDILTGGSPCQDLSHAGRRAGMTEGTRSNLWVAMREAIAQLRPPMVVWENVGGAFSATAVSEVEPCAGCVGDGSGVHLRALGRVLGDLSSLGYDARWHALRAADVGAPHGRLRVFVVATDATSDAGRVGNRDGGIAADAYRGGPCGVGGKHPGRCDVDGCGGADRPWIKSESASLLPTPRSSDSNGAGSHREGGVDLRTAVSLMPTPRATDGTKGGPNQRGSSGDLMLPSAVALLPTPAVNDMGEGKTVDAWDEWTAKMKAAHGNGNGHGASLAIEAQRLLPTPGAIDGGGGPKRIREDGRTEADHGPALRDLAGNPQRWGDYAAAIARWERALGRPAPEPTMLSTKGNPQLSPRFVEWLMGVPAGWITDVPSITRNEALKALGNGVVSQQCAEALHVMESWAVAA